MASNDEVGRFADASRLRDAGMCVGGAAFCLVAAGTALAQDTPMSIIAAQVRMQGHTCNEPLRAERDMLASRPNEAVWTLTCENATYRVTLVPDMAARIEVKK